MNQKWRQTVGSRPIVSPAKKADKSDVALAWAEDMSFLLTYNRKFVIINSSTEMHIGCISKNGVKTAIVAPLFKKIPANAAGDSGQGCVFVGNNWGWFSKSLYFSGFFRDYNRL